MDDLTVARHGDDDPLPPPASFRRRFALSGAGAWGTHVCLFPACSFFHAPSSFAIPSRALLSFSSQLPTAATNKNKPQQLHPPTTRPAIAPATGGQVDMRALAPLVAS